MNIPSEFDSIRPIEPEELPSAYESLLADPQFVHILSNLFPGVPVEAIKQKAYACKTNLEFQKAFCYPFLQQLIQKAANGCDIDASEVDIKGRYTFMSNHRDIVLDSALLDKLLLDAGFETTCEIGIGNNLFAMPWIKTLVRINKSFTVIRGLQSRKKLEEGIRLSRYIHFAVKEKRENIWIAQREGRCKDSNDRTQEAVLKMLTLGGEGSVIDRLLELHIVPTSISYEYDPCDILKAQEFQSKRDDPEWKKGPQDDVISMKTGILGYKGHIHYHLAACLDDFLKQIDPETPKQDVINMVVERVDRDIHARYMLYPCNYIALDELRGTTEHASHYTEADKQFFEKYLQGQMAKVTIPNPDMDYLRRRVLEMYANPAINYLAAK